MKSKEIKAHVEQGYIHINVLFEVVGNPKEHIELMIKKVLEGIKNNKGIKIIKEDYGEAEDAGEGLWGIFCESELLIKDLNLLSWIAFNFSPASIEIMAPKQVTMKDKDLTDFMGEFLSSIHQNNMASIKAKSEAKGLLINFNALMRNTIIIALGNNEKTAEELSKLVGIDEKGSKSFLEAMIKEKVLIKKGNKYSRA